MLDTRHMERRKRDIFYYLYIRTSLAVRWRISCGKFLKKRVEVLEAARGRSAAVPWQTRKRPLPGVSQIWRRSRALSRYKRTIANFARAERYVCRKRRQRLTFEFSSPSNRICSCRCRPTSPTAFPRLCCAGRPWTCWKFSHLRNISLRRCVLLNSIFMRFFSQLFCRKAEQPCFDTSFVISQPTCWALVFLTFWYLVNMFGSLKSIKFTRSELRSCTWTKMFAVAWIRPVSRF